MRTGRPGDSVPAAATRFQVVFRAPRHHRTVHLRPESSVTPQYEPPPAALRLACSIGPGCGPGSARKPSRGAAGISGPGPSRRVPPGQRPVPIAALAVPAPAPPRGSSRRPAVAETSGPASGPGSPAGSRGAGLRDSDPGPRSGLVGCRGGARQSPGPGARGRAPCSRLGDGPAGVVSDCPAPGPGSGPDPPPSAWPDCAPVPVRVAGLGVPADLAEHRGRAGWARGGGPGGSVHQRLRLPRPGRGAARARQTAHGYGGPVVSQTRTGGGGAGDVCAGIRVLHENHDRDPSPACGIRVRAATAPGPRAAVTRAGQARRVRRPARRGAEGPDHRPAAPAQGSGDPD